MYEIYISIEEGWKVVETSTLSLEETILRVLELKKLNVDAIYRIEKVTDFGSKVIEV